MAKLTSSKHNSLSTYDFALPEQRKYPVEDKAHAVAAKAYALKEYDKGNLSKAQEERIDRKANRKLHGVKEHEAEHWGD